MAAPPQPLHWSAVALKRPGFLTRPPGATLLLPLYCVAIFGSVLLILCAWGDVDIFAAIPTAVLISLTALPAVAALTIRGHDLFSPFQLVAGYFLLYYGARAAYLQLNPSALRLGLLEYDDYLPTAAWLAALAFCAFAAGYAIVRTAAPAKYVLRVCPRLPQRAPVLRMMVLAGAGVLAHLYILSYGIVVGQTYTQRGMKEMLENPIPGWLPPLAGLVEISLCVAVIYAMSSDVPVRVRRVCKWFAWICLGLVIFKTVSQGIREYVLLCVAMWILCYHYKRRRVGVKFVAVALASGMLAFPAIQVLRGTLIQKTGGPPQNLADVSQLASSTLEYFGSLSAEDFANLAVASVFDRSQGIDALSLVVKYTPERAPWGLGESYVDIPMQLFVPRSFWPDKPILQTHHDFERTYMGIRFYAQASQHVLADFYSNFAVFGLIGGALAFGMAFKSFYLLQLFSDGRKEILLVYSYVILNGVHKLEADFVAGTVIMVRALIMIAFAVYFLSARRGHPLSPTEEYA